MAKDPERVAKRAAEAARLGITEDDLRAQRKAGDDAALASKAAEKGVSVERYLEEKKRRRNRFNKRDK